MAKKRQSKYVGMFKAGDRFGDWSVINGKISGSPAQIDVVCKCGTKNKVDVYTLVKGKSTNCGCARLEKTGSNAPHWNGEGPIAGTTITKNLRAINNTSNETFTRSDLVGALQSQNYTCAVSNQPLTSNTATAISSPTGTVSWIHTNILPMVNAYGLQGSATIYTTAMTNNINIFEQLGMKPTAGDK